MTEPGGVGEAGGIFAAIVAALVAIGHSIRWCVSWNDRRIATRTQKLDQWQAELKEREATLDSAIIARLQTLEAREPRFDRLEKMAYRWRMAFRLVASELAKVSPGSLALIHAQALLAEDYDHDILEPVAPAEIGDLINQINGEKP